MPFPSFHPYIRQSMSNGAVEYRGRFFYLRVPPRVPSPPVASNEAPFINCIGSGAPDHPIEIFDGSSDEVAPTDLIDPSLRTSSINSNARIPTPGIPSPPIRQAAPPGLIPTQPPTAVEVDIPVPVLNDPGAPPIYAAVTAPRSFPAPIFPTPSQLPAIPPVSNLALQSYIRYATGQPQVEDGHLRAYKSPSPILVSDIPERREPPIEDGNSQDSGMIIFESTVVEARLYVKKALIDYFKTLSSFPLSSTGACKEYRALAGKQVYAQIMNIFDGCLATADTAGINRSNTAVRAVLEQPCLTGGRTGTVRPKHLPAGRTGLSDQFLGPIAQDQPGPVGQICPTSWLSLRLDSVRPTTGRTRLFEHRLSSRVRPVNAGSFL
ncbi:hypothetical protein PCANC_06862 [Puccinia coronata f. sp. avenae]|uniref:Uncharacterized protein n=1 Tax=Puccinia coronata f. sp. avenae TaxID=200324 RepID=A0A2N5VVI5_9BASI|nr:hypothetical protein PCANC_06862 [Puccinia coronata f. sp. avenae]